MESNAMKKILLVLASIASLVCLASCDQKWESSVDLAVYGDRINSETLDSLNFTITVFSNQDWNASVFQGGEWLSIVETSGSKMGYIHTTHGVNTDASARVGKIKLSAGAKEIIVRIVQKGTQQKAADYPDEQL